MGAISKTKAPAAAVALEPLNGFAAQKLTSNLVSAAIAQNRGQFPDHTDPVAIDLAIRAFLAEPATPDAIAVLALSKSGVEKRSMMEKAFVLSRRHKLLTSWMIADSGSREDIGALLDYYDTMLRTSSTVASVILPNMANALSNQAFIEPYARLLSKNPPWAGSFWGRVIATPDALENAAVLRTQLYRLNEPQTIRRDASLIRALVRQGSLEVAEKLYNLLSSNQEANLLLRNGSFRFNSKYPPFDWQLFSTGEYGASIDEGSLNLSAIRDSGGRFARQMVRLPNSIVTLTIKYRENVPPGANMSMSLSCAEDLDAKPNPITVSLGEKTNVHNISNKEGSCHYYWLSIFGKSSGDTDGFDIAIDSITLSPT